MIEVKHAEGDHVHRARGTVAWNQDHRHRFMLVTGGAVSSGESHVHYYQTSTSEDRGHRHCLSGWTSVAVPICQGQHLHFLAGRTSVDEEHDHLYAVYSGPPR